MIQPGNTEADRAAADRLDVFLERLDRVGLEDLRLISLPLPDPDERAAALAKVDAAAQAAGLGPLVAEARRRTQDAIVRAYARHQYEPTWAGLNWGRSLGTTRDRLGLALAAEDAAVAAVVGDLLDDDTAAALSERFDHAAGMAGSTGTSSLSVTKPDGIAWLVWALLVGAFVLVPFAYVGTGPAIAGLAVVALAAFVAWRGRPA